MCAQRYAVKSKSNVGPRANTNVEEAIAVNLRKLVSRQYGDISLRSIEATEIAILKATRQIISDLNTLATQQVSEKENTNGKRGTIRKNTDEATE